MNAGDLLEQVKNFVWLRWRIQSNQLSKSSAIGKVIAALMLAAFCMGIVASLLIGIASGVFLPRLMAREYYFLVWDGFIVFTCVIWVFYLIADLQRSDAITFDRLLHLPVSFVQVFAINYISSWLGLHTLCLSSLGLGFIVGSMFSLGPLALLFLLPFIAFLIALTALTYQLQGWFATLMSNPRRRRVILILMPIALIAIIQVPAILVSRFSDRGDRQSKRSSPEPAPSAVVEIETLKQIDPNRIDSANEIDQQQSLKAQKTESEPSDSSIAITESTNESTTESTPATSAEATGTDADAAEKSLANEKSLEEAKAVKKAKLDKLMSQIQWANLLVPPLWLAGSIDSIVSGTGHFLWTTPLMLLVAWVSLRSNYYATLSFYKGETDARSANAAARKIKNVPNSVGNKSERKTQLVDCGFPCLHEETNAVLGMTWQSMVRAPEVKMYLLLPFITPFILFGVLQAWTIPPVEELKAALVVAASALSMLMAAGLISNQFGFDRTGFRAFVLLPIRRDRILLARNFAIAPFLLVQSTLLAIAVSFYFGFAFDKLLCSVFLTAAMLPSFCLLMNLMSILTPFPLAAGSIQPQQLNFIPILTNIGLSMFLPLIVGFTLIPLGIEWLIDQFVSSTRWVPFALLLSIPWVVIGIWLYAIVIRWQGKLLARREQEILRVVTSKAE